MALLPGGGYAEEVVVDAGSAMRVPDALSDEDAAAIPEVFLTAFLNLFLLARLREGETVLIHGGGSGVDTAATTLAKLAGARVIVTAGSREKCERCLAHGADLAIIAASDGRLAALEQILMHRQLSSRDLDALATDGRIVIIGSMGGERQTQLDVGKPRQTRTDHRLTSARAVERRPRSSTHSRSLRHGPQRAASVHRNAVFHFERADEAHDPWNERAPGKIVLSGEASS
jgi:NADPH:quinone reductase-like Zn-dependent oxidoreductase